MATSVKFQTVKLDLFCLQLYSPSRGPPPLLCADIRGAGGGRTPGVRGGGAADPRGGVELGGRGRCPRLAIDALRILSCGL